MEHACRNQRVFVAVVKEHWPRAAEGLGKAYVGALKAKGVNNTHPGRMSKYSKHPACYICMHNLLVVIEILW